MPDSVPTASARRADALAPVWSEQHGIVSRDQLLKAGIGKNVIAGQLAARRWQTIHPAVYATFTGSLPESSRFWAALLACGEGGLLCHETSASVQGFGQQPAMRGLIHVMIPEWRKEVSPKGVRVHRSRIIEQKGTIVDGFPVTSGADTVLDLIGQTRSLDAVVGWITNACRSGATLHEEILASMAARKRQRHREFIKVVCSDLNVGAHSILENRYLNRVERAHQLPTGGRQLTSIVNGRYVVRDVDYGEFDVIVELDGRRGHEGVGQHRDMARDNDAATLGKVTLRFGFAAVFGTPCDVASQVARVLRQRGWSGRPQPCSPTCALLR